MLTPNYWQQQVSSPCFVCHNIEPLPALDVLTQLSPALHGLYRAISSTSYSWTTSQWQKLRECLTCLCSSDNIDRLNHLIADIIVLDEEADFDTQQFVETFLARYLSRGRPLSGYFTICCVLETSWTVLAQALSPPHTVTYGNPSEAAAANASWSALMREPVIDIEVTDADTINTLQATIRYSMQCFNDLLLQIQEMDTDPPPDTYAWETMSESLVGKLSRVMNYKLTTLQKLASVCSVALRDLDDRIYSRLLLLLSDECPISDNLLQEAALKAVIVLVQKYALTFYIAIPNN